MALLERRVDELGLRHEVEDELAQILIEQKITRLRKNRGLTQAALASRSGVSQPMIAQIESGKLSTLTLKTLARTARALGASLKVDLIPSRASGAWSIMIGRSGKAKTSARKPYSAGNAHRPDAPHQSLTLRRGSVQRADKDLLLFGALPIDVRGLQMLEEYLAHRCRPHLASAEDTHQCSIQAERHRGRVQTRAQ